MNITLVIILILAGILLMLAELFLLPGLSIAGISSFVAFSGSVYVAYTNISPMAGHITLLISLLTLALSIYIFLKYKTLEKMALKSNIDSKISHFEESEIKIGDKGITLSRLAPMGKVKLNKLTVEAKTTGQFIDENTSVEVIDIQGNTLVVESK